jgi:hypothetical protein
MKAGGTSIEKMPPYFLGSIVLIKDEADPNAQVVDGQQRLTTLTLLLAAIRAASDEKTAKEVTPLLYEKGSSIRGTTDRFRLTLRERDREFFWASPDIPDTFDRCEDAIGGVRWNARNMQRSSSERQ